jgi:hypothetical protein
LQKCTFQHHQIPIDSRTIDILACVLPVFDRSEAIDRAGGDTGYLQGVKGASELLGGCALPRSGEKKIARRWQEILPNLRSSPHAHQ